MAQSSSIPEAERQRRLRNKIACKKSREKRKREQRELEDHVKALERKVQVLSSQIENVKRPRVMKTAVANINTSLPLKPVSGPAKFQNTGCHPKNFVNELSDAINNRDSNKFCSLFHHNCVLVDFNNVASTPTQLYGFLAYYIATNHYNSVSVFLEKDNRYGNALYSFSFQSVGKKALAAPIWLTLNSKGQVVMANMSPFMDALGVSNTAWMPKKEPWNSIQLQALATLLLKNNK